MSRLTEEMLCACDGCELYYDCDDGTYSECEKRKFYEKLHHYEDLEEAGKLVEVVRCKDCDNYDTYGCSEGAGWCEAFEIGRFDNGYCDNAKLKELKGE